MLTSIMTTRNNTYLHFIPYLQINNWSVQYLFEDKFSYSDKYELIEIETFLTRNKTGIEIKDNEEYKRVTIKTNNGGVFLRDIKKGKDIGTKKQFIISENQFLLSKIDARNGAFGVVPPFLTGAIVTNDFPAFDININIVNPIFLLLIATTKQFISFAQSCSSGTTNRKRIDINTFLSQKIPLPSIVEQQRLVDNYNTIISKAEAQEQQITVLEENIENYLCEALGIEKKETEAVEIGKLCYVNFSETQERWDIHTCNNINIKKSFFPIKTFGRCLNLTNRNWKKNNHTTETFEYIELSSIDIHNMISETTIVNINKAPSRASQIVYEGDLIIGTVRPYLKKFAIVDNEHDKNVASSGFLLIAPSDKYDLGFVLEWLLSEYATKQFEYLMTGALYPAITSKDLRKIQIPFPPLSIQKEIANHIKSLREQIKNLRATASESKKRAIREFEKEIFR